jgi:hypothetical protein
MEPVSIMSGTGRLDQLVEELESRAFDATTLREIAVRNPDLILKFAEELRNEARPQRAPGKTQLDAIIDFVRSNDKPVPTALIADKTGIERSAVRSILYANSRIFRSTHHPDHAAKRLWTLRDRTVEHKPTKANGSILGPTAAVVEYLRQRPTGATGAEVLAAVRDKIRTDAADMKRLIYGTLGQLRKAGRVSVDESESPMVYKIVEEQK